MNDQRSEAEKKLPTNGKAEATRRARLTPSCFPYQALAVDNILKN